MNTIPDMLIEKRSHHFKVYNLSRVGKNMVDQFSKTLIHWGYIRQGRSSRRAPLKVFAASNFNRDEYRFHINDFDHFISFAKERGLTDKTISISTKELKTPERFIIPIKEGWVPRENQYAPIEYIVDPEGPRQRLIVLYTGAGKSLISMLATSQLEQRFIMVARPMFLDKWVLDIEKTFDIPKEEIMVIRGGTALMSLIEQSKNGTLDSRVILLSNKTFQLYINNYERYGKGIMDLGYDCTPDDLFEVLGGGIRIIDEVHLDFHFNFKLDLYTHTERSVSMTATLLTDDAFIRKMHDLAYPVKDRYSGAEYKPYINSIALMYQFEDYSKIKYLDYSGKTYSHHVFEKSIMRNKHIMENYLKLIVNMIELYFLQRKDKKEGDKFMVFCSSIEMCTKVTKHLNEVMPDMDIRRYVEDDPYDNLLEPIGRVTTLLSAGTGVDIDQLAAQFLTTAVNSSPSNVQGFGRLRPLKDGRSPIFVYFNDMNNPKHMDYHSRKLEIIKPRSLNFKEVNYSQLV